MRKIFTLLCLATFIFTSCSNDDDFIDTDTIGQTFDFTTTFSPSNEYSDRFMFPENIFDSDVVLVYRLENVDNGLEVWEPLPTVTIFLNDVDDTSVQYRYNFTSGDVDVILESNNLDLVPADLTNNQKFRVVVVPSEFAKNTKIDLSDFNAVQSALKLDF
ncbi:hypothetical protein [Aquimarina aquimarini]|uniref:hypothetical protein n=1 Tax=Aquimarina aquimarini TaxID=1191734 RepID=UPI000D554520|nr:hypothetical protein [Aquimarina aquimarini]